MTKKMSACSNELKFNTNVLVKTKYGDVSLKIVEVKSFSNDLANWILGKRKQWKKNGIDTSWDFETLKNGVKEEKIISKRNEEIKKPVKKVVKEAVKPNQKKQKKPFARIITTPM